MLQCALQPRVLREAAKGRWLGWSGLASISRKAGYLKGCLWARPAVGKRTAASPGGPALWVLLPGDAISALSQGPLSGARMCRLIRSSERQGSYGNKVRLSREGAGKSLASVVCAFRVSTEALLFSFTNCNTCRGISDNSCWKQGVFHSQVG